MIKTDSQNRAVRGAFGDLVWATGHDAIALAERLESIGLEWVLSSFTSPIDSATENIDLECARSIAAEDPSLVYLSFDPYAYGRIEAEDTQSTHASRAETPVEVQFDDVLATLCVDDDDYEGICSRLRSGWTH